MRIAVAEDHEVLNLEMDSRKGEESMHLRIVSATSTVSSASTGSSRTATACLEREPHKTATPEDKQHQTWSESRAARIEALRASIRTGTYKVDSRSLAEAILQNETHLL